MAEEIAAKRLIFRQILRLIDPKTLPTSEVLVMASLGGEGGELDLRWALEQERENARVWFIDRDFSRTNALNRTFRHPRFYHGVPSGFRLCMERANEPAMHLIHWDLTGQRRANIQPLAFALPFLWRSETRLLAVTLDDSSFGPSEQELAGARKVAVGFFDNVRAAWKSLLAFYRGVDQRLSLGAGFDEQSLALRELSLLLTVIFAPAADLAVASRGQDLAPLDLLARLSGKDSRIGWFMNAIRRNSRFMPSEFMRYVTTTASGIELQTYIFRYAPGSDALWERLRGSDWLRGAPLTRLTDTSAEELRETKKRGRRPRQTEGDDDLFPIAPALPVPPPPTAEVEAEPVKMEEDVGQAALHMEDPDGEVERVLETHRELRERRQNLEDMIMAETKKTTSAKRSPSIRPPSKPAPAAPAKAATLKPAKETAPVQKTEADHVYDRLLPIKDMISPSLWQNIETLYAEAKRERRPPDHSKRIAALEGLIAGLREEQGDGKGAVPTARLSTPSRPAASAPAKPATKPKPSGQNGNANGADLQLKVIGALKGKGKMRTEELTKALGMDSSNWTLRSALKRLRDGGKVRIEGEKRGTTYELVA